jgi:hypothetical protein
MFSRIEPERVIFFVTCAARNNVVDLMAVTADVD